MRNLWAYLVYCLALLLLTACTTGGVSSTVVFNGTPAPPLPDLDPNQVKNGAELYASLCSACHGEKLEGQPNWKEPLPDGSLPAPPHDNSGHTWHHPDDLLIEIILQGGGPLYGGTMPGFAEQIDRAQAEAILAYLKSFWGEEERRFQWWLTATQPGSLDN